VVAKKIHNLTQVKQKLNKWSNRNNNNRN